MEYLREKLPPPYLLAVDVGCGSGQSTNIFSKYFSHVIGIDVSKGQVEEATKAEQCANVVYQVGDSSSLPGADGKVQLVTAFEAAHWFDLPVFYEEVDRVLSSNGVLAITGYWDPEVAVGAGGDAEGAERKAQMAKVFTELHKTLGQNAKHTDDAKLDLVRNRYRDVVPPYPELSRESILHPLDLSVDEVVGWVTSWSGFQSVRKTDPAKADELEKSFRDRLKEIFKTTSDTTKLPIVMEYFMILCRKP